MHKNTPGSKPMFSLYSSTVTLFQRARETRVLRMGFGWDGARVDGVIVHPKLFLSVLIFNFLPYVCSRIKHIKVANTSVVGIHNFYQVELFSGQVKS